jgi:aspartyl protease family protein
MTVRITRSAFMRNLIILGFLSLLIAGSATQFADRFRAGAVPPSAPQAAAVKPAILQTAPSQVSSGRKVTLRRDRRGHFATEASINGRRLDLMVDTGASVVALTRRDAERIGFSPSASDFTAQVQTANGRVKAAPASLPAVEIGGIVVRNVQALIVDDAALTENLLGLSFLSRLSRYEYKDGQLVMEQ